MSGLQEVALDDKIELSNNMNNVAPTTETIEQAEETVFVLDDRIYKYASNAKYTALANKHDI